MLYPWPVCLQFRQHGYRINNPTLTAGYAFREASGPLLDSTKCLVNAQWQISEILFLQCIHMVISISARFS